MSEIEVNPRSGLTAAEQIVADALVEAVNAFHKLKQQHPSDSCDFCDAIHRCQDIIAFSADQG